MAKVRIRFEETVSYEAVIETDLTPEELEDGDEEQWFALVEEQHPGWVRGEGVDLTVDERDLLEVVAVED